VDAGFSDSSIYISKYFLGYNIDDWGTVIAGKQKNPFYTTDLVWDSDINPMGLTQAIAFHKLGGNEPAPASEGYSKDGKTVASYTTTSEVSGPDWGGFELTLIAGQLVYNTDNDESALDSDASNDVYLFNQQLLATYRFNSKTSVSFAPGFMIGNAGDLSGFNNEKTFSDAAGVSGESRELAIITAPGDVTFAIGGLNTRFYWDFAYNVNGEDRYYDIYSLNQGFDSSGNPVGYSDQDAMAWLLGLEVGQGKGKGAWTVFANYRETGIASVDPNLNDSDFALGRLNTRGFKFGATYGFTDFLTAGVTGFITYNQDDNLFGGQATGGAGLADRNAVNTVQVDLSWKF